MSRRHTSRGSFRGAPPRRVYLDLVSPTKHSAVGTGCNDASATALALTCSCRCITQGVLQGAASCSKSSTYRHPHVILETGRRRNRASCPWAGRRARSVEVLHSRNHSVRTTPATTTPARPCHACTQASTVLVLTVAVPVCRSALPDARIPKALQGSSVRAIEHAMHRQRVNATSRAHTAPASHSHGYVCAVYVGWWCGCLCSCMPHAHPARCWLQQRPTHVTASHAAHNNGSWPKHRQWCHWRGDMVPYSRRVP